MDAKVITAAGAETHDVLGMPHAMLVRHGDSESGYEVVEITGPDGAGVPPHVHEHEDETFYVIEGEAVFTLDGTDTTAPAGAAAHLPRGIPHAFRLTKPGTRLLLTISPGSLAPMFADLAAMPDGPPDPATIAEICGRHGIRFV